MFQNNSNNTWESLLKFIGVEMKDNFDSYEQYFDLKMDKLY